MKDILRFFIGATAMTLFVANIIFWIIPLLALSLLKFLIPIPALRRVFSYLLNGCASCWISVNSMLAHKHCQIDIEWPDNANFSVKDWYLVMANHQSWVDIYVLQKIFNRKIPFLKFFLKKELIYVPLLGLAWWALDFPFMKRHNKAYLKKHPEKKGQDLETTKKACEKFKHIPISVMNFVEGTRFTPQKAKKQNSPYKHLLKPKSGGIGTVLSILGEQMNTVVDVTIHYPDGIPTFWDFLCARLNTIKVKVRLLDVKSEIIGDMNDSDVRIRVQTWLNQIWIEKDQMIENQIGTSNKQPESASV
ncbi:acyltransferase [Pleionea sediminis]|uniref:acyltransferase n=1 Tax=Pleionea sediminis TaxID=2569479 RepID=UPI001186AFE2|nr:acyltransferase [Pleionea sediminis]